LIEEGIDNTGYAHNPNASTGSLISVKEASVEDRTDNAKRVGTGFYVVLILPSPSLFSRYLTCTYWHLPQATSALASTPGNICTYFLKI
jgi:hypothetical protein